jgi:hypothetical protein
MAGLRLRRGNPHAEPSSTTAPLPHASPLLDKNTTITSISQANTGNFMQDTQIPLLLTHHAIGRERQRV